VTDDDVLNQLDPDNLPTDPEELAKLLGGDVETEEESETEPEADDKTPESSPEQVQEDEEAPVLSADGKHQIPYSVLKQEREAKRAFAEEAARLQQQLEALQQAQQTGLATPTEIPPYDPEDPEVKALEEEFPEIAKLNAATRAEITRLRQEMQTKDQRLEAMASAWEREQQAKQQAQMEEVNAAIDTNPVLRYLRSEEGDSKLWQAAVEIDVELQNRPGWANKSVAERFAKVVERLEEDYGPVQVPAGYQSVAPAKPVRKPKVDEVKEDLTINTLSDLKGGSSPESDGINLESASAVDLQAQFMKMTPQQQEDWLARFA
jgi:hypothetical protein